MSDTPIPPQWVEAAVRAIYEDVCERNKDGDEHSSWAELPEIVKSAFSHLARAAIEALLPLIREAEREGSRSSVDRATDS